MASRPSSLGYALLGLLHFAPQSGYDLRKTFLTTPLSVFSDSPGAIYPALRRLARQGWIAAQPGARGGRRRQVFAPTAAGRRAFRDWLGHRPTRDDVARGWGVLMLRLAFMGAVPDAPLRTFLEAIRSELQAHVAELARFEAQRAAEMPLEGRLAFASGLQGYRAQLAWAESALAKARRKEKR